MDQDAARNENLMTFLFAWIETFGLKPGYLLDLSSTGFVLTSHGKVWWILVQLFSPFLELNSGFGIEELIHFFHISDSAIHFISGSNRVQSLEIGTFTCSTK